uniref:Hydroxysteroid (17-beta) dehydrogenase 3 n=1 Tax=Lates calcarifer TaxID=8187 RepID=A0A4W6CFH6_LATCA
PLCLEWKLMELIINTNPCIPVSVVTGASEGIGRAYAFAVSDLYNVQYVADPTFSLSIGDKTGRSVKVIVTDFVKENVFGEIEDQLKDLSIGVLVNNVGILPSFIPCKFLECAELDQVSGASACKTKIVFCLCLSRGKGVILNISSGIASIPFPLYTLYASSKVFVERFSRGLQIEYEDKGIIIQVLAVAPFGVSTRMAGYQKTNLVTLSPEDFVKHSLQYLKAGDKTFGSVHHIILVRLTYNHLMIFPLFTCLIVDLLLLTHLLHLIV